MKPSATPGPDKWRVLVVDDDAAVRMAIKPILERAGYDVVLAADPVDAAAEFTTQAPDLLILDLNLPLLNGWDLFERLTTRSPLTPVIIMTGMPDQFQTAVAAGAAALLEKPVDVPELLGVMQELLSEPARRRLLRLGGYLSDTRHLLPAQSPGLSKPIRPSHASRESESEI